MNYCDFEIQLSGESPNHYSAKVIDKGNVIAQTFELRPGELKVIEGLQRLEDYHIALSILKQLNAASQSKIVESNLARLKEIMGEEAFNKTSEEIRRKHDT